MGKSCVLPPFHPNLNFFFGIIRKAGVTLRHKVLFMSQNPIEDLQEIRRIMERSGKFTSVSGWSGILAGLAGLGSAGIAFSIFSGQIQIPMAQTGLLASPEFHSLVFLALATLLLALVSAVFLTANVARQQGQSTWTAISRQLLVDFCIPLALGGIFCAALAMHQLPGLMVPVMLLFYGMALLNASHKTLPDIRYLGYCQLAVGISALIQPGWGFWFWLVGFGLLHLVYGGLILMRYPK